MSDIISCPAPWQTIQGYCKEAPAQNIFLRRNVVLLYSGAISPFPLFPNAGPRIQDMLAPRGSVSDEHTEDGGPFDGLSQSDEYISQYEAIVADLISEHPLSIRDIVEICIRAWNGLLDSRISKEGYRFFYDIHIDGRTIGNLLHDLIPRFLSADWRVGQIKSEKDCVYIPIPEEFDFEVKGAQGGERSLAIHGNRSQDKKSENPDKPDKSGYFLALNYNIDRKNPENTRLTGIRFGWLDESDWKGQEKNTGQQSQPHIFARKHKLARLFPVLANHLDLSDDEIKILEKIINEFIEEEE
uniref:Uncharacterized protein n=1 Tax=uncultured marine group II/III euryarchaeote AD1000_88_C03 TaxID=1457820 RepID=A0A075G0D1_9EURY|nr:hypothetical protein [uncultured marine group II/III euryarchaeote AD1000_88_C03]